MTWINENIRTYWSQRKREQILSQGKREHIPGENGKGKNQTGAGGKDLIIKVPPGTEIYNDDKSVLLADLVKKEQKVILAQGGKGGLGNINFKSSTNQAPRRFTYGQEIEEKYLSWLK